MTTEDTPITNIVVIPGLGYTGKGNPCDYGRVVGVSSQWDIIDRFSNFFLEHASAEGLRIREIDTRHSPGLAYGERAANERVVNPKSLIVQLEAGFMDAGAGNVGRILYGEKTPQDIVDKLKAAMQLWGRMGGLTYEVEAKKAPAKSELHKGSGFGLEIAPFCLGGGGFTILWGTLEQLSIDLSRELAHFLRIYKGDFFARPANYQGAALVNA